MSGPKRGSGRSQGPQHDLVWARSGVLDRLADTIGGPLDLVEVARPHVRIADGAGEGRAGGQVILLRRALASDRLAELGAGGHCAERRRI